MQLIGFLAALALFQAGPARLEDPESHVVEELVVQAREPGPAWWRVEDADTTVWILGMGDDALPADLSWDRKYLDRRMAGASSLIVGTRIGLVGSLRDVPALLRARAQLRSKRPLEETLPEPLRARFVAVRERIGQPAKRYASWRPLVAGQLLVADAQRGRTMQRFLPPLLAQAKKAKIPVIDPARYKVTDYMGPALAGLTPAVHQQCLEAALTDAETPPARARSAAEGWARGDVAAALREPRAFEKCLLVLGGGAKLWRQVTADNAAAIAKALERPGHSVALVSLRQLLADDGVIEQLEARGVRVAGPAAP